MSETNWQIGHLDHLESPWANAGGVVKSLVDVQKMANTGVGWIEAGSYTLEQRHGNQCDEEGNIKISDMTQNPIIVYSHDFEAGETQNSLGMPNQGLDTLIEELPEMISVVQSYGKRLVINVAPVTENPVEETKELVGRVFETGVDGVLLNLGCPNVLKDGMAKAETLSQHPREIRIVLAGIRDVLQTHKKIFVRTSPYSSYDKAKSAYSVIKTSGVVGAVWTPNSWPLPPEDSRLEVAGGGISGPATADAACEQAKWAVDVFNGSGIDVVSSGGIMNAMELQRRLSIRDGLGGRCVSAAAGTTFYYESVHGWEEDTDQLLTEFSKAA